MRACTSSLCVEVHAFWDSNELQWAIAIHAIQQKFPLYMSKNDIPSAFEAVGDGERCDPMKEARHVLNLGGIIIITNK